MGSGGHLHCARSRAAAAVRARRSPRLSPADQLDVNAAASILPAIALSCSMSSCREPVTGAWRCATAGLVGLASLAALTVPADARGGHGGGRGFSIHGMHGSAFAGDARHGNDPYIKAASEEENKLLNTKLKSICRGC